MLRKLAIALMIGLGIFLILILFIKAYGPEKLDRWFNKVVADMDAPEPSPADEAFHRTLFIADLHADTLKWERDLLERGLWGHVDLPRLVEGHVALQSFTIVTKSPLPFGFERYKGEEKCVDGDRIDIAAILAAAQGRPFWGSKARALSQIERMKDAVARSREEGGPEFMLIETADDLATLMQRRRLGEPVVGALLGIEGGHWIGGEQSKPGQVEAEIQELFDLGVRQFAPNHRFDNNLAGSSEGCDRYGLTEAGKVALKKAEELGMVIDLAHISELGMDDAAQILNRPFIISHTGIKHGCEAPCRSARNLSDQQLQHVIDAEGLVGIGFWPYAVGQSIWRIGDVMEYIMGMASDTKKDPSRYLALGSDYDGSVTPFFDAANLPLLTAVFRQRENPFNDEQIQNIMGLNVCRLFAKVLPGGNDEMASEICEPES